MIIIFGTSGKRKVIQMDNSEECPVCSKVGGYSTIIDINYFTLFWIPVFRVSTRYYVVASCCGSVYSINKKLGREIERGRVKSINQKELYLVDSPYVYNRECPSCHKLVDEGYGYCPFCGNKM